MRPRILRSLLLYNRQFAAGGMLLAAIVVFSAASVLSPRGQDGFWQLSAALRNTLLFGLAVALLTRVISLGVGLVCGYLGGFVDRVIMSLSDAFLAIPTFPLLVLVLFVFRASVGLSGLALIMSALGWAGDARLIRAALVGLRAREFTHREHMRGVLPIIFSTAMTSTIWAIGMEIALTALGLADISAPTIGGAIFRANQHAAGGGGWPAVPVALVVALLIGLFLLSASMNEYIDPRMRPDRVGTP